MNGGSPRAGRSDPALGSVGGAPRSSAGEEILGSAVSSAPRAALAVLRGLWPLSAVLSLLSFPGSLPVLLLLSVCRPLRGLTFPLPTWCTVETSPHDIYTESCTIRKRVDQRVFTQCRLL